MIFQGFRIGIPKEIMSGEKRVSATPETTRKMVEEGAVVLVETGAGSGAHFTDDDYREAGASIIDDVEQIFAQVDMILKVKEPLYSEPKGKHEIDMMKSGQYLITFIHPASPSNHQMVRNLAAQGVTSLSLDSLPRISRVQDMDALTSMSTVAGYKAVLLASNRLGKFMRMVETAVGFLPPAKVLVIGMGVAGLQALATAKGLGAMVYAADIRKEAVEHARSLAASIVPLNIPDEVAVGHGGYARRLPAEWLEKEREDLKEIVSSVDMIILCALVPGKLAPVVITEEMVKSMKNGSVIVDVSIDQGGNCSCTKPGEVITTHGVSIDGTKNIPSMLPESSTWMFANNIYNFASFVAESSRGKLNTSDEIISSALVTFEGKIVHAGALEAMNT
ncbi:MAG: NAD(P) transhydrogenase subunit alpha [Acidobacteriota bacterium]